MSGLSRRGALIRLGAAIVATGTAGLVTRRSGAREKPGRVIDIEAKRFRFTPNEIVVKRGEVLTLALRALDFAHGFSIPDLGIRTDLIPGQVVSLRIQPMQSGRYAFLCDNFCGEHHEEMGGSLIVET